MQIIPRWHKDTVAAIGGPSELLKVESNVWAGGQILREYVDKAGSIPKGLVRYNASVNAAHYSQKVLLQKRGFEQMLADL
jgi:soluble lytic murein transglycosylase-like protein